jgi:hypothetical protein
LEIQRILEQERDACECSYGYSEALFADYNCAPNEALKELKQVGDFQLLRQSSVNKKKGLEKMDSTT